MKQNWALYLTAWVYMIITFAFTGIAYSQERYTSNVTREAEKLSNTNRILFLENALKTQTENTIEWIERYKLCAK